MKELESLNVGGKRVFLRGDIDVPIINGAVEDTQRLQYLIPTIRFLRSKNSKVLLTGHIGRPENNRDFSLSTKPLLPILSNLLDIDVVQFKNFESVRLSPGTLGLLENLRFWEGEEKNDENFTRQLANLADVYVDEAFAASHREHASIVGVPRLLPHAAGFHFQKEVEILSRVLKNPKRPQVVIVGGVKLETKLPVIESLSKTADWVLVGGELAGNIKSKQIQLASNVVVAKLKNDGKDIDEKSIEEFCNKISQASQIILNGAMGLFEEDQHAEGTREVVLAVANSNAEKIAGGDATIFALKKFGFLAKMDWVSSGGGAMLEFLSGKELPGIKALES